MALQAVLHPNREPRALATITPSPLHRAVPTVPGYIATSRFNAEESQTKLYRCDLPSPLLRPRYTQFICAPGRAEAEAADAMSAC